MKLATILPSLMDPEIDDLETPFFQLYLQRKGCPKFWAKFLCVKCWRTRSGTMTLWSMTNQCCDLLDLCKWMVGVLPGEMSELAGPFGPPTNLKSNTRMEEHPQWCWSSSKKRLPHHKKEEEWQQSFPYPDQLIKVSWQFVLNPIILECVPIW